MHLAMWRICLMGIILGLSHDVSKASECVSRGRFPNNDELDCRGYTMCLIGGTANFTQYKLTCPLGSVYSHLEQLCTSAATYSCLPTYICNTTGNFENLSSENCTSYISCVHGLGDLVTARLIECPAAQVFNPEGGCVNEAEYRCHPEITTEFVTEAEPTESIGAQISREIPISGVNGVSSYLSVVMLMYLLIKCF